MATIILVSSLIFTLFITTIVFFVVLKRQRQLKNKTTSMGMQPQKGLQRGSKGSATLQGVEYTFEHFPGAKNAPSYFRVSVDCPSKGSFKLAKETGFDRFFKKLGICCELKTGDIEFDERYYISTNTVAFARSFFSSPEKRQAIREIYNRGFNRVEHDGKTMIAQCSPFRFDDSFDQNTVAEIAAQLLILRDNIPDVSAARALGAANWKIKRALAFATPILLDTIGTIALVFGLIHFLPLDVLGLLVSSLKISLSLLLLFLWIAVMLLKGRSSSHRELVIVVALSLFAFPLAGAGLEVFLNGWMDKSQPMTHMVEVVGKDVSRSDKSTSYYAIVTSWREQRGTERIKISYNEFQKIVPHQFQLSVTIKSGKFGFEWLLRSKSRLLATTRSKG